MPESCFRSAFWILILIWSCQAKPSEDLIIATAANAQFAISEIAEAFESETGIPCSVIVGSSGKLAAQIMEGAPFHCFVSADMDYPNQLKKEGMVVGDVKAYAMGKLVLFTRLSNFDPDIRNLGDPQVRHIALANPKLAPYGKAALEAIHSKYGEEELKNRFVYGESLSQVGQFVTSGTADIGFVSKSLVLSPGIRGKGNWKEVDPDSYYPILQGVVCLKNANVRIPDVEKFISFLTSSKGREILSAHGYKEISEE